MRRLQARLTCVGALDDHLGQAVGSLPKRGLDHHSAHPVIPAGCRNPVPWMASLSIGSKFDILALAPGILLGRRLDGIMIKDRSAS
jgi:hypothetical protein